MITYAGYKVKIIFIIFLFFFSVFGTVIAINYVITDMEDEIYET